MEARAVFAGLGVVLDDKGGLESGVEVVNAGGCTGDHRTWGSGGYACNGRREEGARTAEGSLRKRRARYYRA